MYVSVRDVHAHSFPPISRSDWRISSCRSPRISRFDSCISCPVLNFFLLLSISQKYKNTFLAEDKPVFNVEYNLGLSVCDSSNKLGLDTIVKVSEAPSHSPA